MPVPGGQLRRAHLVEEDEGSDRGPLLVRQGAVDLEAAQIVGRGQQSQQEGIVAHCISLPAWQVGFPGRLVSSCPAISARVNQRQPRITRRSRSVWSAGVDLDDVGADEEIALVRDHRFVVRRLEFDDAAGDLRAAVEVEAGLLPQLAPRPFGEILAGIEPAARRRPQGRLVAGLEAEEQEAPGGIQQHDAGGWPVGGLVMSRTCER